MYSFAVHMNHIYVYYTHTYSDIYIFTHYVESRPPAFVAVVTKMRQWVTEADDPRMVMYRHRDRRRDKNVADICCTVVIHCSSLIWSSLEFLGVPWSSLFVESPKCAYWLGTHWYFAIHWCLTPQEPSRVRAANTADCWPGLDRQGFLIV